MTGRARLLALLCALAGAITTPPTARAVLYGPTTGGNGADIVSVDNASDEQGDSPTQDAAVSANGRYVVFQTRATNFFADDGVAGGDPDPPGTSRQGGIFRYDRPTGALALVADGTETKTADGSLVFLGAANPSVSADGRYVAFSTAQQLVPADTNDNVDVYVRDMSVPLTANRELSGAYMLVSAKDGGDVPATYVTRNPPLPGANPGAEVWPHTAISGDGRTVVFRTPELASDLPDRTTTDSPPGQLFVRGVDTHRTVLLSRSKDTHNDPDGDPAGGARGPAAISADGSTVAWVSTNAAAQTAFLPGESLDASQPYYLWMRWRDQGAVARRITGIADPDDPACPPGGGVTQDPQATGPCYGPLNQQESSLASISSSDPALSADGYTVAFLAGAALRPNVTKSDGLDVFTTIMAPGVSRKAGTRELTLAASSGSDSRGAPTIESLAMSADASTIAFTTVRDEFVLPNPTPMGTFRPQPTVRDLYVIDLGANTLQRALLAFDGSDPNDATTNNPTISADGATIGFASAASNLIFGDANEAADAFTISRQATGGTGPPPKGVNSRPPGFSLTAATPPDLGVTVRRGRDGSVILLVDTPGPGRLTAVARGRVATAARRRAAHGKKLVSRTAVLAQAGADAPSEGSTTMILRLPAKYRAALAKTHRIAASVTVAFTPPPPAQPLSQQVSATFVSVKPARTRSRRQRARHR